MINLIVLASGLSRRFGQNKLLLPVNGKCMYRHVVDMLSDFTSEDTRLFVVTGHAAIEEALAENPAAQVIHNANPEEGQAASIRLAAEKTLQLDGDSGWDVFFVADQPFLSAKSMRRMLDRLKSSEKGILRACSNGTPGNPVAFAGRYRREFLALRGDVGGRAVIRAHPQDAAFFEVDDPMELCDIDRPEQMPEDVPSPLPKIFLTGEKGIGKSTLIARLAAGQKRPVYGLITRKIGMGVYLFAYADAPVPDEKHKVGICTSDGPKPIPGAFDRLGAEILSGIPEGALVVLDELGILENSETAFQAAVFKLFDGKYAVLAALRDEHTPFLNRVAAHGTLIRVTAQNRDALPEKLREILNERTF